MFDLPICVHCNKNIAVVFITKYENDKSTSEGICIECAEKMGINPYQGMASAMGLDPKDLEGLEELMPSISEAANELFGGKLRNENGEDASKDIGDILNDKEVSSEISRMIAEDKEQDEENDPDGRTRFLPFVEHFFSSKNQDDKTKSSSKSGKKKEKSKRKFLPMYCQDLTKMAMEGKIDNIVGRDNETQRVIQILNRRNKNNPCLIGEPGVGKTAIAEGLALAIVEQKVPAKLLKKEVHLLDLTALVAGTQFRGQFESRIKGLIQEIKQDGNVILVIDEVHSIAHAGDSEGSMSAANILKPALSRGEIQVVGATTLKEYRKYIEKDSALERRFQPVMVSEPNIEESINILKGIAPYYSNYHNVTIPDELCKLAAVMSERYITERFLPDKAIDLLDEACSGLNLIHTTKYNTIIPKDKLQIIGEAREKLMGEISEISDKINTTDNDKDMLSLEQSEKYKELAKLKGEEVRLEEEIREIELMPCPVLTADDLARIVELWTNIPASKIQSQEFARLMGLEERLSGRIIGQDEAIKSVSLSIRRARASLSAKKKPISFIFVGPTGVGKTELVKALAEDLFDSIDSLIRVDMTEFMEKHAVSRLIGSPPGYVGYDDAGQLTEKIRRRPYSIVLFDEIEKAHPDVMNILLQVLDDGYITDAQGRKVNFENCVIVMTSNAGSDRNSASVGFGSTITEQSRSKAIKALESFLRPEFLNRIDEVISFNQLNEDDFGKICKIMLFELSNVLKDRDIRLTYDDNIVEFLVKKGYNIKYGARNLRRIIQKEVEDKIASIIITSYDQTIVGIHLHLGDDEILVKSI